MNVKEEIMKNLCENCTIKDCLCKQNSHDLYLRKDSTSIRGMKNLNFIMGKVAEKVFLEGWKNRASYYIVNQETPEGQTPETILLEEEVVRKYA